LEKFENKLVEANRLIKQGNFTSSLNYLDELHEIDSNNEEVNFLIAQSHFFLNNFTASLQSLTKLLKYNSKHLQALKLQFKIYHQNEQLFDAYKVIKKIITLEQIPENQYELAIICTRIGKVSEAKHELELYIKKITDNAFAYLNLGHMHKAFGDFDLAEECYFKFTELAPKKTGYAIWNIADLKDRKITTKELRDWKKIEDDPNQEYLSKLLMQFSLGMVLEKQKNYDEAFEYLLKANANKEKISPFNQKAFNNFIKNITSNNSYKLGSIIKGKTPIFIVGLPRSGSTLVEQIVANHDLVNATDELNFIGYTAAQMERTGNYAKAIDELDNISIGKLRQEYIDYAAEYQTSDTPYFIDKNPLNFFHIGLIFKLFPEAKIIHTHRSLLDNAVSLFKRYFYVGHDYSYSMSNITSFMAGYAHVMRHWESLFPGKIFHSQYEQLVENSEEQIKSILSYCELGEQDECFAFYKQKRIVLTPSVDQVNKPINSSSVNSWLCYEEQMLPYYSKLTKINDELLMLGKNVEQSAWNNYWQQGYITSFGSKFKDNYVGIIEKTWLNFFNNISSKSKILDVATGNGAVLDLVLSHMPAECKAELIGVDYSQVKNIDSKIKLISEVNVENLPFDNASFTHVSSQYGIEYSDLGKSIPEVSRILRKFGEFQFVCHCKGSVILAENNLSLSCTKELLQLGGAVYLLEDMLVELNKKQLTGSMDERIADEKRNKLNNELSRLLNKFGDELHDTMFPLLIREVLKKNITIAERDKTLHNYISQQSNALIRLEDLTHSALDEEAIVKLKGIANNSGLGSITITELVESDVGLIGVVINGVKL